MFNYMCGIILIIWEIFCCKILLEAFAPKRIHSKWYEYFLLILLGAADFVISIVFKESLVWKEVFVIAANTYVMWRYFKIACGKSMLISALFQGLVLTIDYVAVMALIKIFPVISTTIEEGGVANLFVSIIDKVLLFCVILVIKKNFGTRDTDVLTSMEWIKFSIFPLFTIVTMVAIAMNWGLSGNVRQENVLLFISIGLLLMNIIVFYLINDVLKREMQIREDRVFRERVKNETENYERQRKQAHEYKNQLSCIVEMAQREQCGELKAYVQRLYDDIGTGAEFIDTNRAVVNAVLNSKLREGREKGILFVIKANDLSGVLVGDEELVILLSNLLNNAIEACEKCKENKWIKVKFIQEDSRIILSVQNSMHDSPVIENGTYLTSKVEDTKQHGIGIGNIVEVIEKYGGSYVISPSKEAFQFAIIIPSA